MNAPTKNSFFSSTFLDFSFAFHWKIRWLDKKISLIFRKIIQEKRISNCAIICIRIERIILDIILIDPKTVFNWIIIQCTKIFITIITYSNQIKYVRWSAALNGYVWIGEILWKKIVSKCDKQYRRALLAMWIIWQ